MGLAVRMVSLIGLLASPKAHAQCGEVVPRDVVVPPNAVIAMFPTAAHPDGCLGSYVDLFPTTSHTTETDGRLLWIVPREPLITGVEYGVGDLDLDSYGGPYRHMTFFVVGEVSVPEVHPTWTLEREDTCRFDGYHHRAQVDLGVVSTGLFEVESVEDELVWYGGLNEARSTTVDFGSGSGAGCLTARFFDVTGRLVRALVDQTLDRGPHEVTWNGQDERGRPAPAGLYFVRLSAGGVVESRKLLLSR